MDDWDRIYIVLFSAGFAFLALIGYIVVLNYEDDIKQQDQYITDLKRQVEYLQHKEMSMNDNINHPKHYTSHPSGIECIQITEHMDFCIGNAIKYLWRAGGKNDEIEDLKKAIWYIQRKIDLIDKPKHGSTNRVLISRYEEPVEGEHEKL